MPKTKTHYVGDPCKGGHWFEHRSVHWSDEDYREASGYLLKYKCGFCKSGTGPGSVIGLIGRKPWTYICLTCIGMRVLGEEFFKWTHNLQGIAPVAGAPIVELEKPMLRIQDAAPSLLSS